MRFIREPLVHFLAIGATLFLAWALWGNPGASATSRRIVVDQGTADRLARNFALTYRRAPTADEWKKLVDDDITTEVLVREALKLGLDKDDIIIRQRLRQKMEFLGEDLAAIEEPTDEDLRAFLEKNADYFLIPDADGGSHLPPLEEIRPTLVREWKTEQREKANKAFLTRLKKKYTVIDELPPKWWDREIEVPATGDTTAFAPRTENPR